MRTVALALFTVLFAACGSETPVACDLGRVTACACPGGSLGAQECGPLGVWSACVCSSADAGADVAAVVDREPPADAAPDREPVEVGADASSDVSASDAVVDVVPVDACASSTPGNCCGVACRTGAHASAATCAAGRCGLVCEAGFGDCDGDAANGCEVDMIASPANCGACGAACREAPGIGAQCVMSRCVLACPFRTGDCDGMVANGCEVNLNTAENCGACGVVCPAGRTCSAGVCR